MPRFQFRPPDHYLPLLYVPAAGQRRDPVRFPVEGVDGGSISMLTVQVAAHQGNTYEWEQHVSISQAAGVRPDQFIAIA